MHELLQHTDTQAVSSSTVVGCASVYVVGRLHTKTPKKNRQTFEIFYDMGLRNLNRKNFSHGSSRYKLIRSTLRLSNPVFDDGAIEEGREAHEHSRLVQNKFIPWLLYLIMWKNVTKFTVPGSFQHFLLPKLV